MLDAPDQPRRPRRLRRVAVPILAAAVAAILVVPAALARTTASQQPRTAAGASIPASAAAASGAPSPVPAVPARPVLLALADRLVDAPADTAPGAYSYIETRSWAMVNVLTGSVGSSMTFVEEVHYQQLWQDGHGNGRMTVMNETSGCEIEGGSGSWSGNKQPDFFGPPAVTDPVKLRQQLLAGSGPGSPGSEGTAITGGVAGTAEKETLRRPVRAAMLRLLADVPGLLVRQPVTDRAGRPGIDVILPYLAEQSTPTEHTLTFDPATGVLLASFYRLTGPSASSGSAQTDERIAMFRASFDGAYRLYLASTFTPTTSAPAPACVPATSSPAR